MTDDTKTRFQLVISRTVLDEVKKLASEEQRSVSNMLVVLVMEAVKARKSKRSRDKEEGNSRPALLAA